MRAKLYALLRRTLSQRARNRLKRQIAYARRRLRPLYRARFGTVLARDLVAELSAQIPADTEIIMVHCSYNDLEPTYVDGLAELLAAVCALPAADQTLVMPAFFFADGDPFAHYRVQPLFDVRRQPSQMGILSESFRRRKTVRRSLHPTHSVCADGPLAELIVQNHHLAQTTFGQGTPFAVMADRRTAIVGLGTEYFRCLTQIHAAEDLLGERFPLQVVDGRVAVQLRDEAGAEHPYQLQVRRSDLTRRLELMEPLLTDDVLHNWRYKGIPLFVASAAGVTRVLVDAALGGATVYEELPIRPRRQGSAARRAA